MRESEERYKAFHSIPDALLISNLEDGKIIEVNDYWQTLFTPLISKVASSMPTKPP